MNALPKGITGFFNISDTPPPSVDEHHLQHVSHTIARQIGGRIIRYDSCSGKVAANYHVAIFATPSQTIAILCNAHFPLVAFTNTIDPRFGQIHFIEAEGLAQQFIAETTFLPLAVDYLCAHPSQAILAELSDAELKQIRYWQSKRIGDIIYNHWD